MAGCNCGSKRAAGLSKQYQHIKADGTTGKTYSSEADARMAVAREGGKIRPKS